MNTWEYPRARVAYVVDGDTVDFEVDLGLEVTGRLIRVRLAGIGAPELLATGGPEAANYLSSRIADGEGRLRTVRSTGRQGRDRKDTWGRYLAWYWPPDWSETINAHLVEKGFAVSKGPYLPTPPSPQPVQGQRRD